MDGAEQPDGLCGLVRLEPSDTMQAHLRMSAEDWGPFSERLLDPVLAEIALPCSDEGLDLVLGTTLADGDQLDLTWITLCERRSLGNFADDLLAAVGGPFHAYALYEPA